MRSEKRPRVDRGRENNNFLTFDSISTFDIIEIDVLKTCLSIFICLIILILKFPKRNLKQIPTGLKQLQ